MVERFIYIEPVTAHKLLSNLKLIKPSARGCDKHAYLIGNYAVLTTSKLKLRNITTRDDDLAHYDELIKLLMDLYKNGVSVIPVLGYCYDPDSKDGDGYIIQQRAKGEELFDDAVMKAYYVWTQKNPENLYFYPNTTDAKSYILARTKFIAEVPQKHFNKFVSDTMILTNNDILIDFIGKSNFFYDKDCGFQFIDLDSHTDYKYGLCANKDEDNLAALLGCFTPCHLDVGTRAFEMRALDKQAMLAFNDVQIKQIKRNNMIIFEKCMCAIRNYGFSDNEISTALAYLKIYGMD
ncbi:MAG: hypothetical protein K2O84_06215 [Oscillospiraceae bacterium]|nr:hypothetical protein [Oscillospiraceae bacterium]